MSLKRFNNIKAKAAAEYFFSLAVFGCLLFSLLLYFVHLLFAVGSERALYADGANTFVTLLSRDFIWPLFDDAKHIRLFVNLLNQWPTAAAIQLGVQDLNALKNLFGVGHFLIPAALYGYCLYLSRRASDYRVFTFAALSLITCALPSEIFIQNPAFTALALYWIALHYILLNIRFKAWDFAVLGLIFLILFRSHEGMILWGSVIALASGLKTYIHIKRKSAEFSVVIPYLGLLGFSQVLFALYWQYSHPVEQQTQMFLDLIRLAMPFEMWDGFTKVSLITTGLGLGLFGCAVFHLRRFHIVFTAAILFAGAIMFKQAFEPILDGHALLPFREFSYRFLIPFFSPLWMLLAMTATFNDVTFSSRMKELFTLLISLSLGASAIWQISNSYHWNNFRQATSNTLRNSTSALIGIDQVFRQLDSQDQSPAKLYAWPWAWSVLGFSQQQTKNVSSMLYVLSDQEPLKIPRHKEDFLRVPFVSLFPGGYFQIDSFLKRCEEQKCEQELKRER